MQHEEQDKRVQLGSGTLHQLRNRWMHQRSIPVQQFDPEKRDWKSCLPGLRQIQLGPDSVTISRWVTVYYSQPN